MRHILVPTDFSKSSQAALKYASELCRELGGRITLLHVHDTHKLDETLMGLDAVQYLSRVLELPQTAEGCAPSFNIEEVNNIALQKLDECAGSVCAEVPVETQLTQGRPAEEIVGFACDHSVDIIVMATHGRGPVAKVFLGSVADKVVRTAVCPVLIVPGTSRKHLDKK